MHALNSLAIIDTTVIAGFGSIAIAAFFLIGLLSVFWIWMLIDCLLSELPAMEKLVWFLVIFWLHFVGALLYFLMGHHHNQPSNRIGMV